MLKNILNLEGAKALNKQEQNAIQGGAPGGYDTQVECENNCSHQCIEIHVPNGTLIGYNIVWACVNISTNK